MDIFLYDVIGDDWYGDGAATAKGLRDELSRIDAEEPVTLRINSPGGDVMEAVAMVELLGQHRGEVTAKIDGMAASAASFLAATIGKVTMAKGGLYMIHNPWSIVVGEADDMRREADVLDKVRENLAAQYESRSKLSYDDVVAAMNAETWYTADEALAAGLVDAISDASAKAMAIPKKLGYKNAPQLDRRSAASPGPQDPGKRSPRTASAMQDRIRRIAGDLHRVA